MLTILKSPTLSRAVRVPEILTPAFPEILAP
jgi:hypothetical protein